MPRWSSTIVVSSHAPASAISFGSWSCVMQASNGRSCACQLTDAGASRRRRGRCPAAAGARPCTSGRAASASRSGGPPAARARRSPRERARVLERVLDGEPDHERRVGAHRRDSAPVPVVNTRCPRQSRRRWPGKSSIHLPHGTTGIGLRAAGRALRGGLRRRRAGDGRRRLDAGIRYFDVAPQYGLGLAERRLGAALRGRDDFVVSTKVGRLVVPAGAGDGQDTRQFAGRYRGARVRLHTRRRAPLARSEPGATRARPRRCGPRPRPRRHLALALAEAIPALCALRDEGVIGRSAPA